MQRMNFRTENQLKWSTYIYIVLFFLAFLLVFLLLANLDRVVSVYSKGTDAAQESRTKAVFERLRSEKTEAPQGDGPTTAAAPIDETGESRAVSFLGDAPGCEVLKDHLDMLKWPWRQVSAGGEISGLIIVAEPQLDQAAMDWLLARNEAGAHLLFTSMPPRALLEREDIRARLGLDSVGEWRSYPGMRASKEMMLGSILEYGGGEGADEFMDIEAYDVELTQQIKVFAHALPRDHLERSVTELPPLFWRYAPGGGKGYVYVCNGNFLSDETAYALLPTVLGDINGGLIYPIVNAYCTMVDGFPYAENEDKPLWRQLYSRDSYGIQRELLLPEWKRIENMYGVALTHFSPAYDEIMNDVNADMRFYHTQFQRKSAELAGKSGEQPYLYSPEDPLRLVPTDTDFSFESEGQIQLPYLGGEWLSTAQSLFRAAGMVRGLGYVGLRIDVAALLAFEDDMGLPSFFEQLETLLGYQCTLYPWLERMTAQEAVERIDTYIRLQPKYSYHEFGVRVELDGFDREAWFLLKTYGSDPKIDSGSIEKIGEYTYLVEITAPRAEITWSGEEE